MTYYQFVQAVEKKVKSQVKESHAVHIHTAQKNNGVWRKGLTIEEKGINIAPTIYLEEYYQQFQQGSSLESIAADIMNLYNELRFQTPWKSEKLKTYEEVREKIVYRLISRERNQELLTRVPYVPYLDLAVVFAVILEISQHGIATMLIQEEHLKEWGIDREEIYRRASENTCRLLPVDFQTMGAVIEELTAVPQIEDELNMCVLTNRMKNYGAAVVLYKGELEAVGRMLEENYYLLPSSVHEMLILPESCAPEAEELNQLIVEINEAVVDPEEVLGDHAYYYDREKNEVCWETI